MKSSVRTSVLVSVLGEALSPKPHPFGSRPSLVESPLSEAFLAELPLFKPAATVTPMRRSTTSRVYQLKITLQGSKPAIWRRVLVAGSASLRDLHRVIQVAMGWGDDHLHAFRALGRTARRHVDNGLDLDDEDNVRVGKALARAKSSMLYEYDFGDSWRHEITVEKTFTFAKGMTVPSCIDGKRACPPEDCGGLRGYAEIVKAIRNRKHPEHDEIVKRVGENFDPAHFDMQKVNERLTPR